jgi:DNA-binding IclR family transcriptional regulator
MTKMKEADSYIVPALKKGLKIIEMFSEKNRTLTLADFADELGTSTSSIYRTVITLTELNYLKKVERNSYQLGPMVLSNGFCYLASQAMVHIVPPFLEELRDKTSSSCHLGVREGVYAIYIYSAPSRQRIAVNIPIGSRFVCHRTAIGRALLTGLSDEKLSELFSGVAMDYYSLPTPSSIPALLQCIAKERQQGYCVNKSDSATAIAVPIVNYTGEVVAAINVSSPDNLMTNDDVFNNMITNTIETGARISKEFGG